MIHLAILFSILVFCTQAFALTFEGTLFDSNGVPIAENNVKIKAEIFDDGVTCILFEREHSIDLSSSSGHFKIDLSSGTPPTGQPHELNQLDDALSNANGNTVKCADNSNRNFNGSFVKRQVRITIFEIDGTDITDITLPFQDMTEVPFARQASSVREIGSEQVDTANIADSAITNIKIATGIDAQKLTGTLPAIDGSNLTNIAASAIASNSVGSTEIADDAVGADQLGNTGVTPGNYGSSSEVATFTVDAQGRITTASSTTIADMSEADIIATLTDDSISGDKIQGGIVDNFQSTGIDDNASANAMTIDSSGNIGIGTTSPTTPLHMLLATGNSAALRIETQVGPGSELYPQVVSRDTGNSELIMTYGTKGGPTYGWNGHGFAGTQTSHHFSLRTQNVSRMVIQPDGDVGIGTLSPSAKLEVSTTSGDIFKLDANSVSRFNVGFAGDTEIVSNTGSPALSVTNNGGGNLIEAETDKFVVNEDGHLGIGTASPIAPLSISNTANGSAYMSLGAGPGLGFGWGVDNSQYHIFRPVGGGNDGLGIILKDNSSAMELTPTAFHLRVNSVNSMSVDSAGNVGVGTSTPNSKLEVEGYIQLDTNSAAPAAADCDAANEYGRMRVDPDSGENVLYICTADGWQSYSPGGGGGSTPSGAVMAFELASCPTGWSELTGAAGRVIVGVGSNGTNTYTLSQTGGADDVTLTVGQLPSHYHTVDPPSTATSSNGSHTHSGVMEYVGGSSGNADINSPDTDTKTNGTTNSSGNHSHTVNIAQFNSGSTGSGDAVDNRQMFYALKYCKKD